MKTELNTLSLTRRLLSFNTINPPGQERQCAHYLGRLLEDGGFKVAYHEFDEGRTSLVARLTGKPDRSAICFCAHMDTVPLGTMSWRRDPFRGEVDGDRIYGRGSSDMKAGIAAMVIAALRLRKFAKDTAGITLVFTAGEETGSLGASYLAGLKNKLRGRPSVFAFHRIQQ